MAREKNERWQGDGSIQNNPFASLSALKHETTQKSGNTECADSQTEASKLPKMKSARVERAHRGGKTITIVSFHQTPSEEQKKAWLKIARRELGVGGQMEDGDVVLQGDLVERLKTWNP